MINRFLIIIIICISTFGYAQSETGVTRKAPNFKLENLSGETVELNKEVGDGPILLSFWATWCKPCIEELGEYKKLYDQYSDKGFKMFAISTDNEKTVSKVKPFVKSKSYEFPILLDTNSDVARLFYAQSVPFTVVINKDGYIVYSHLGYMRGDEENVKNTVTSLLKN
jgi:cytochrome c biogenesis protein CcmG, thiol:disulfide interchange protein DsbE